MPRSLSSRLLLAFALVIVLSLGVSAVGTLLLLRDQQRSAAEERVGRLAEPITLVVALLEEANVSQAEIQSAIEDYGESFDVRVLLVDDRGYVVGDTESRLTGRTIDVFHDPRVPVRQAGSAKFRMAGYDANGEALVLFAPAEVTIQVATDRLVELQTLIFELYSSGVPVEVIQGLMSDLAEGPETTRTLQASLQPLVAVPEEQITSAWRDVIPQLALAGGIALLASAAAAVLVSRSVTRRLERLTQAAQEMSHGNYEQQLDPGGDDEIGRLGRAFNVMARQVSHSDQMMRDLLADVSHELKTPLTSIQGFSQAIEEGAVSSPKDYLEAGRIINEEAQRMRRLVDDLIELSRLESGQAIVQREPVDLGSLLQTCASRFEWQLKESGAEIDLDLDPLSPLTGDERRLEQAFSNLIDNAVRHVPSGGKISVRAEAQNGAARVTVHNTGSFIPKEDLRRVFERFYQMGGHRSRVSGGAAGLGLTIANEVVQAHNGTIEASSDREQGTSFVVTLPLDAGLQRPGGGRGQSRNGD